jgi:hypothetical protein
MVQDIRWKFDSYSACQKIACFLYGTRTFITVFTEVRHRTLSWAKQIHLAPSIPKVQLNVILPPTPRSFQRSLPSGPPNQISVNISPLPHSCYISRPLHPPWFNHPNNIRWKIQTMKFIIRQFPLWSVFLPFRPKYPPQHSVLKSPQSMFRPRSERPSFSPIQHHWKNYRLEYFNLRFFNMRREGKRFWTEW